MSVGFGFSVGDFLAALNLVGTVIDSLRSSGKSGSQYRSLITELYIVEDALIRVKRVELDDAQSHERIALEQAAAHCQHTVDAFMNEITQYQPHLKAGGSGNRIRDAWMKVKWAICKNEDLEKFKAEMVGHRGAIELLLLSLQMSVKNEPTVTPSRWLNIQQE